MRLKPELNVAFYFGERERDTIVLQGDNTNVSEIKHSSTQVQGEFKWWLGGWRKDLDKEWRRVEAGVTSRHRDLVTDLRPGLQLCFVQLFPNSFHLLYHKCQWTAFKTLEICDPYTKKRISATYYRMNYRVPLAFNIAPNQLCCSSAGGWRRRDWNERDL